MIQRELSQALRRDIKDPRLTNVSITDVVLTPDLSIAKIYFTLVQDAELAAAQTALRHAAGHFRHIIAMTMDLRYTPNLSFYHDETLGKAERLSQILKQVETKDPDENN